MVNTILVTGAGGYLGQLTIRALVGEAREGVQVISHDIKEIPKPDRIDGVQYLQGDIRTDDFSAIIDKHGIQVVIHLVSIVNPGSEKNRDFEYAVDVKGTENLLKACVKSGVRQFIVTSSGAAYGYFSDNPQWLTENDPIRGNKEFSYAYHKRLVEEMLAKYRVAHPAMKQLILRPGTVLGAKTNNRITDLFKKKFILGIWGSESPFVFIWDEDVVAIIIKGILEEKAGIFNLAGDGFLTMRQIATKLGKPYLNLPGICLKAIIFLLQKLGIIPYGPEQVRFLRYRPVLSNTLLKEEFGYTPRYTSAEVFDLFVQANFKTK